MTTQMTDNEPLNVTGDDIAAFVNTPENETADETAVRARRVLTQSLRDPVVRERLLWLRNVRAEWETEEGNAQTIDAARLVVLQARLRETTHQVAGMGDLYEIPGETRQTGRAAEKPAAHSLWHVWKTGGGRWTGMETTRSLREAVQRAGDGARHLILGGQRQTVSLPCLAPALAARAADAEPEPRSDAITTADGVRITFQQSPSSWNRMRVFVDASHLTPVEGADGESSPPYNVAFLTLMEGDDDAKEGQPERHSRHLLVVALNARGTGFSDFSVTPVNALPSDAAAAQKCFPTPLAGGCRLVSATLSQMPPQPESVLDA